MKTKAFYTCGINWQHDPAINLFDSVERLKEQKNCWQECGIVKVEVVEKEWVEEQDLDGCNGENNYENQQDDNYDYECDDVRHYCGACGCEPCQCDALSHAIENGKTFVVTGEMVNNEMLRLQKGMKDIFNLSFAAWEQVTKNPEEAKRLFKKIHSIASGGEYMMEHPDFYPENEKPDEDVLDDEEEALLNRLCDAIETECFGEDFDYSRGRMKKTIQRILDEVTQTESAKEMCERLGFEEPSEEQKMANLQANLSHLQRGEQNE